MAPDFGLGKVYVIRNTENAKCYVGSTVRTLAQRMSQHRMAALKNSNFPLYVAMREIGISKFYVELLLDAPCERREQLHKVEGNKMRELNTLTPNGYNVVVAGRGKKEFYMDKKETIRPKHKAYYEMNKEKIMAAKKVYVEANKDAAKNYAHAYYVAHSEEFKAKQGAWYAANKDTVNARKRERNAAKRAEPAAAPAEPEPAP